jgi:hypothetical protein
VPLRVLCNRLGDYLLFPAVYRFAVSSSENTERTESPRRDLNARPKVYETFALPAELLGQLVSFPVSRLLLGFAQFRNTAV